MAADASIRELCEQLDSDDQVKAYQARQALSRRAGQAGETGNDPQRNKLAADLAEQLTATKEGKDPRGKPIEVVQYSASTRGEILRALSLVAGQDQVGVITKALEDLDVREMARFALDRMTCQGATDALLSAARTSIGSEFRVGVVCALASRAGSQVIEALKQCAKDTDTEVRLAAAEGLAGFADASLDKVLTDLRPSGPGGNSHRGVLRIARARLRLAENLARDGKTNAARAIYTSLSENKIAAAQQAAARAALANL